MTLERRAVGSDEATCWLPSIAADVFTGVAGALSLRKILGIADTPRWAESTMLPITLVLAPSLLKLSMIVRLVLDLEARNIPAAGLTIGVGVDGAGVDGADGAGAGGGGGAAGAPRLRRFW